MLKHYQMQRDVSHEPSTPLFLITMCEDIRGIKVGSGVCSRCINFVSMNNKAQTVECSAGDETMYHKTVDEGNNENNINRS